MNYYHLTIYERTSIYIFKQNGMSIRDIARALDRNPSTISRELRRNKYKNNSLYQPTSAQNKYIKRRVNCHRKKITDEIIISSIKSKIEKHFSPEQIYGRSKLDNHYSPSTSTIYRMIHDKRIKDITMEKLRRKGHFKRPKETRGKFNVDSSRTIKKRPKDVYKRIKLGNWEGDTVESGRYDHNRKSKVCFVTLAERKSRFYIAIKVETRESKYVTPAIINALKDYPQSLLKTITFDRGKEFSGYKIIEKALKVKTYFCDPYCAWQKGTNENTNGLLREYYPKGMDLSEVDEEDLKETIKEMNNRPRKCIGFKTPKEALFEHLH